MESVTEEFSEVLTEKSEKMTISQLWDNQPPALHWCMGLTCLSFGFIYMLLFTML